MNHIKIADPCNHQTWSLPRGYSEERTRPQGWVLKSTFRADYQDFGQVIVTLQDYRKQYKKKPEADYFAKQGKETRARCVCSPEKKHLEVRVEEWYFDPPSQAANENPDEGFFWDKPIEDNFQKTFVGKFRIGGDKNVPAIYFEGERIIEKKLILEDYSPSDMPYEFDPAENFRVRVYEGKIPVIRQFLRENLENKDKRKNDGLREELYYGDVLTGVGKLYLSTSLSARLGVEHDQDNPCAKGKEYPKDFGDYDYIIRCSFPEPSWIENNNGWDEDAVIYQLDKDNYRCGGVIEKKEDYRGLCNNKIVPRKIDKVQGLGILRREVNWEGVIFDSNDFSIYAQAAGKNWYTRLFAVGHYLPGAGGGIQNRGDSRWDLKIPVTPVWEYRKGFELLEYEFQFCANCCDCCEIGQKVLGVLGVSLE